MNNTAAFVLVALGTWLAFGALGMESRARRNSAASRTIGVCAAKEAIELFRGTAEESKDVDIRSFAGSTLPTLQITWTWLSSSSEQTLKRPVVHARVGCAAR